MRRPTNNKEEEKKSITFFKNVKYKRRKKFQTYPQLVPNSVFFTSIPHIPKSANFTLLSESNNKFSGFKSL